jgi:hypothetical protein
MHGELSDEPILAPVASVLQQNKAEATDWRWRSDEATGAIKKLSKNNGRLKGLPFQAFFEKKRAPHFAAPSLHFGCDARNPPRRVSYGK